MTEKLPIITFEGFACYDPETISCKSCDDPSAYPPGAYICKGCTDAILKYREGKIKLKDIKYTYKKLKLWKQKQNKQKT